MDKPCPHRCPHVIVEHRRGRTHKDGHSVVRCDLCLCAYSVSADRISALDG